VEQLSTKAVAAITSKRSSREIIDLKTLKKFNVSWAASPGYHSDITPMTPADVTVLKSILQPTWPADDKRWSLTSSWSWTGRQAVINIDGRLIASGYHTRPHAAIMGGSPGLPFVSKSNTAFAYSPNEKWPLGGHLCLYYGDSPGGTPSCNQAAKDAFVTAKQLIASGKLKPGTPPPPPDPNPVLKVGSSGDKVREAQDRLNVHGANPKLFVDGGFGTLTDTAVKAFKKANNLSADGTVDLKTWEALRKAPVKATTVPPAIPQNFGPFQDTIQAACKFSHPKAVWDLLNEHPYAMELYRKLAEGFTGATVSANKPVEFSSSVTIEECKAVIQALCKFSKPQTLWDIFDKHSYPADFYRKMATSMASAIIV